MKEENTCTIKTDNVEDHHEVHSHKLLVIK